jgi:hypothetical protein
MKTATPRRELVAECCRAAMVNYALDNVEGARKWIATARLWRERYAEEIAANNAWIRANPAEARRWRLSEMAPAPEC